MNKNQEKVLLATLCGLAITAAAAVVVQPVMAIDTALHSPAHVATNADWRLMDHGNSRALGSSPVQVFAANSLNF